MTSTATDHSGGSGSRKLQAELRDGRLAFAERCLQRAHLLCKRLDAILIGGVILTLEHHLFQNNVTRSCFTVSTGTMSKGLLCVSREEEKTMEIFSMHIVSIAKVSVSNRGALFPRALELAGEHFHSLAEACHLALGSLELELDGRAAAAQLALCH